MANPWFRMYAEFADDPKVQMMPEAMQRRLLMLFCERCKDETLHETERAFHWRITEQELAETKALFLRKEFIDEGWNLANWNKRQFLSDSSTDRVRKHRQGKKQDETLHGVSGTKEAATVTPPDADTEADTDTEKGAERGGATPARPSAESTQHPKNPNLTAMLERIVMAHPRSLTRKQRWGEAGYSQKTAVLKAMQDEIDASGCSGSQALEMILARVELQAREVPEGRYQFFKDIERYFALHEYRLDSEHFNREDRNASTQGNRAGGVPGLGNRKANDAANALDSFYARIDAEAEGSGAGGTEGVPEPGREPGRGSPGVVLEGAR